MASGDTLVYLTAANAMPESRGNPQGYPNTLVPFGLGFGIGFAPDTNSGAVWVTRLPKTASLATGLTLKLLMGCDPVTADPGKTVKMEVSVGPLGGSAYYTLQTASGLGTAATGSKTTPTTQSATAPKTYEFSIAILTANLGSGVAADAFAEVRVRRLGADATDTSSGREVLLGVSILDT